MAEFVTKEGLFANNDQIKAYVTGRGYQTSQQVAEAITAALGSIDSGIFVVVSALPDVADAQANKIYLVPAADSTTGNTLDEYILVSGAWEKIGSSSFDLTGYWNSTNLTAATAADIEGYWA
jgi:hypothetical protein